MVVASKLFYIIPVQRITLSRPNTADIVFIPCCLNFLMGINSCFTFLCQIKTFQLAHFHKVQSPTNQENVNISTFIYRWFTNFSVSRLRNRSKIHILVISIITTLQIIVKQIIQLLYYLCCRCKTRTQVTLSCYLTIRGTFADYIL